jgi:hypothetical protein
MPSTAVRLVIDDPENFHLLTNDMKEMIVKGGIATVNVQAALTRRNAVENVREDFILRNNFTTSQIQFQQMEKARFISLSKIQSTVGITQKAGYMARQETGGERVTNSGGNLAIPTSRARGGNKGSPVMKKMYLSKVKRVRGDDYSRAGGTYRSKLVARAAVAFKNNLLMRFNDELFSVLDFQKKADGDITFKLDLIYNLKHKQTFTHETPWLMPAAEKPAADVENIFISQMKKLGM